MAWGACGKRRISPPPHRIRIPGVCASPGPKGSHPWPADKQEAKLSVFPSSQPSHQWRNVACGIFHNPAPPVLGEAVGDLPPSAHEQLLIGAACSISAPGLNEVTQPVPPEVCPAGELVAQGPRRPAARLGKAGEAGSGQPGVAAHPKWEDLPGRGASSAETRTSQAGQEGWTLLVCPLWSESPAELVSGCPAGRKTRTLPAVTEAGSPLPQSTPPGRQRSGRPRAGARLRLRGRQDHPSVMAAGIPRGRS